MKITEEKSRSIRERFHKYRSLGMGRYAAQLRVAEEEEVGRTTVIDHVALETSEVPSVRVDTGWPKSFIVSGWDLRVKPDLSFIACLEQMAELYDAELLLVPCQKSDVKYLSDEVKNKFKIITETVTFNQNIKLKYVQTAALTQSALAGHTGAYPGVTVVLPGLVKELRTEPSQHYVKQLISTGSIGHLDANFNNYSSEYEDKDLERRWKGISSRQYQRPTAIAENYVVPSALIIDILDEKTFLTRFVTSERKGIVYDLNKKFTPEGYVESNPLALMVGDTHAYQVDNEAWESTKQMVQMLNPREVILNDVLDGISINHHEAHDPVKVYHAPSLREEADVTRELLDELSEISNKIIYLQSNHDDFLLSWLNSQSNTWRLNKNYELACGLQLYRTQTQKHPIIKLLELDKISNLKFITDKEQHYVGKVLVKHGHEGSNGARTGFLGLAKIYNYYIQGHLHSPAVFRNAVCVGLTAKLDLGYNRGASGWLHLNAIIQPDSSIQALPIIQGKWIA